jgi:hypothetical protein
MHLSDTVSPEGIETTILSTDWIAVPSTDAPLPSTSSTATPNAPFWWEAK